MVFVIVPSVMTETIPLWCSRVNQISALQKKDVISTLVVNTIHVLQGSINMVVSVRKHWKLDPRSYRPHLIGIKLHTL